MGAANVAVALAIAAVFMHLAEQRAANCLVFATGVIFVLAACRHHGARYGDARQGAGALRAMTAARVEWDQRLGR
jgi:hypothetical protein